MFQSEVLITKVQSVQLFTSDGEPGERIDYSGDRYYYELIYIFEGHNICVYDGKKVNDIPGVIRFLPNKASKEYYVDIISTGKCIDIYFDSPSPLPSEVVCFDFTKNVTVKSLFTKALTLWNSKTTGHYHKCMACIYEIFAEIEKSGSSDYMSPSQTDIINPAIEYINAHYCDNDFSYKILPKLCNVSYTYFRQLFIKRLKTTPHEYVTTLKIQKACELLALNRFSVSEISELCGYNDVYYFSKQFKQKISIPPSLYMHHVLSTKNASDG